MKISTNMIDISSFQKYGLVVCSETNENCSNSSRLCHQSQKNSKATSDISMKFIEKFTELTLENSDDVKSAVEEVDKNASETIVVDCSEKCINQKVSKCDNKCATNDFRDQLPDAKISIKEKDRESVCLNCYKETSSHKKQELNVNMKNLSLTQLISRSPIRAERQHCKVLSTSYTKGCNKHSGKQQNNICSTDENTFNFCYNSSIESSPSQQQLHGSGGSFNETNSCTSLYDNRDFYIESVVTPPESFTDSLCEQLSPVSLDYLSSSIIANNVESSSGSTEKFLLCVSKPSTNLHDCSLQSIVNNNEPRDTEQSLPGILDLYPTPPHSSFENALPFPNDILPHADEYDPLLGLSWPFSHLNEDVSLMSQSVEEIVTTDVSLLPSSEKSSELDKLSPSSRTHDEEIKRINCYLKNGDVNPLIAQLVTDCSECLGKTNNENSSGYHSASANGQSDKLLCSDQQSSFNNEQTKQLPVATGLPSSITSFQPYTSAAVSTYSVSNTENQLQSNKNNVTSSTILLMPIQLQTIAISGLKDKNYPRELKPKHCSTVSSEPALSKNMKRQVKRVDYNGCQMLSETSKTNSVYHGGYKSVKEKIGSSISPEEKNKLLKLLLKEQSTTKSETRLHSAVLSGDETLVYAIIESWRSKIYTDHRNSRIDTTPRIFLKKKIQEFVNVQNSNGCTPLYYATLGNNNLLTAYLLECGADPYIKDNKDGNTPFHIATIKGDDSLVLMELLSYNRSIGNISKIQNNKGQTVLISAVINHGKKYNEIQRNGIELIKYLLRTNHELSKQDIEGRTALHIAVLKKDLDLLEVLLTFATDGNAKFVLDNEGNSVLHLAATLTDITVETHCRLIHMIILHCSKLTEMGNKMGKLPYELVNENRKQERDLLKVKMDEYGFKNL